MWGLLRFAVALLDADSACCRPCRCDVASAGAECKEASTSADAALELHAMPTD